jgi:hypothetical protein
MNHKFSNICGLGVVGCAVILNCCFFACVWLSAFYPSSVPANETEFLKYSADSTTYVKQQKEYVKQQKEIESKVNIALKGKEKELNKQADTYRSTLKSESIHSYYKQVAHVDAQKESACNELPREYRDNCKQKAIYFDKQLATYTSGYTEKEKDALRAQYIRDSLVTLTRYYYANLSKGSMTQPEPPLIPGLPRDKHAWYVLSNSAIVGLPLFFSVVCLLIIGFCADKKVVSEKALNFMCLFMCIDMLMFVFEVFKPIIKPIIRMLLFLLCP